MKYFYFILFHIKYYTYNHRWSNECQQVFVSIFLGMQSKIIHEISLRIIFNSFFFFFFLFLFSFFLRRFVSYFSFVVRDGVVGNFIQFAASAAADENLIYSNRNVWKCERDTTSIYEHYVQTRRKKITVLPVKVTL